jgi:hypothetical protein
MNVFQSPTLSSRTVRLSNVVFTTGLFVEGDAVHAVTVPPRTSAAAAPDSHKRRIGPPFHDQAADRGHSGLYPKYWRGRWESSGFDSPVKKEGPAAG